MTFLRSTTLKCVSLLCSFLFHVVLHDTPHVLCGRLCRWQVWVIVNKAVVNTDVQVFVWTRASGSLG